VGRETFYFVTTVIGRTLITSMARNVIRVMPYKTRNVLWKWPGMKLWNTMCT